MIQEESSWTVLFFSMALLAMIAKFLGQRCAYLIGPMALFVRFITSKFHGQIHAFGIKVSQWWKRLNRRSYSFAI